MDHDHGESTTSSCLCPKNADHANTFQVNEYIAYYLLTNYDSNTEVKSFVDKYDFYVFPIVNPDGMTASLDMYKGIQK